MTPHIIKAILIKFFGSGITAVTSAWDFTDWRVHTSSLLSITFAGCIALANKMSIEFFGISAWLLIAVIGVIIADFITGLGKAYILQKRSRRQIICAAKGIRSAYKLGVYLVYLYATTQLHKEFATHDILNSSLSFAHIYLTIHIVFWEIFSVDRNMKQMGINLGIRSFLGGIYNQIFNKTKEQP